jgi:phosphatidylglycerophosphatase A
MEASEPHNEGKSAERFLPLSRFIATGFYSGYLPGASGTWGSLVGLLIVAIPGVEQTGILLALILVGMVVGVPAAAAMARTEGHRLSKVAAATKATMQPGAHASPDPSIVVIDEIVGMWVTLVALPKSVVTYLLAFLAFRIMDIVKPEPARLLEHFPDGWGIMLDDVVAGLYANLATHVILFVLGRIAPTLL